MESDDDRIVGTDVSSLLRHTPTYQALDQLSTLWGHEDDGVRAAAAVAGGQAILLLADDGLDRALRRDLLTREPNGRWPLVQGKALTLGQLLRQGGARVGPYRGEILAVLKEDMHGDQPPVREAAVAGLMGIMTNAIADAPEELPSLLADLAPNMVTGLSDANPEVRRATAGMVKTAAKASPAALRPHLLAVVQPLLEAAKDTTYVVRLCACADPESESGG